MPSVQPTPVRFTALILAGDRGAADPVCQAAKVPHKCLAQVGGKPMLERVVDALVASPWVDRIAVVLNAPEVVSDLSGIAELIDEGRLLTLQAAGSPSRSVLKALEDLDRPIPLLVTTADHALLSRQMIDHFCAECAGAGADLGVGVTTAGVLLQRYPESRRTFLRFRDERYSGSNLFAFLTPVSRKGAQIWRRAEQERKRPWRIAAAFGPVLLLSYLFRRLSLDEAMHRVSRRLGIEAVAIKMPFAEAAIDVDKPEDLNLVEEILRTPG